MPSPLVSRPVGVADPATGPVLAVDGNSLGHRGFHSAREDPRLAGLPFTTGAVMSMLASAWVHGPYAAVVIAFDHPVNQRKLDDPGYKSHRPDKHPDLDAHLTALRTHLDACGFVTLEVEGAEADDLLAATVDACDARQRRCDVLSSDRDLTAVVGPHSRLLRPRARFADLLVEDEAAVERTYGVPPHAYVELAALRGDPSDGLQGAPGIGPKTAARLIRQYGSVAALYDALCDLPPRVEAALRQGRADVERNVMLMAPLPHLTVDVDHILATQLDPDRIERTLRDLNLEAAARRFVRALTTAPAPRPPLPPVPDEFAGEATRTTAAGARASGAAADFPGDVSGDDDGPANRPGAKPPEFRPERTIASAEQAALF